MSKQDGGNFISACCQCLCFEAADRRGSEVGAGVAAPRPLSLRFTEVQTSEGAVTPYTPTLVVVDPGPGLGLIQVLFS